MHPGIIPGLFSIGKDLINKWFPDPEEASKREAELSALILTQQLTVFKEKSAIIQAESKSEHFLVAAWRPIIMLLFGVIIANNYIIYPYLSLFMDEAPMLEIPPDMWDLLKLGLSGYVIGRSGEKIAKNWKGKNE